MLKDHNNRIRPQYFFQSITFTQCHLFGVLSFEVDALIHSEVKRFFLTSRRCPRSFSSPAAEKEKPRSGSKWIKMGNAVSRKS